VSYSPLAFVRRYAGLSLSFLGRSGEELTVT
jgi:hypothetical protein